MLTRLSDVLANVKAREAEAEKPALDTRVKPVVRILNGALDEDPSSASGVILNGRVDPSTLRFLKADSSYQRPLGDRDDIFQAIKAGVVVPNIDVGVRGQDFTVEGDDYIIHSPAYVIDGWQRVGNAQRIMELMPDIPIRIFATVHFGTNEIWERHRFTDLNKNVRKVSPNLHMRNMRDGNDAVLTLYGLCHNAHEFALYNRVCWSQNAKPGEIVSARVLALAAAYLHAHHGAIPGKGVTTIATSLTGIMKNVGQMQFRKNVAAFFDVIEEAWGIRSIELSKAAPQIKTTLLLELARFFSTHKDFWDAGGRIFFVSADNRRKLAKFPINDPHIKNLCASAGAAATLLADLILKHMNSGKRTHFASRYADGTKANPLWRRAV